MSTAKTDNSYATQAAKQGVERNQCGQNDTDKVRHPPESYQRSDRGASLDLPCELNWICSERHKSALSIGFSAARHMDQLYLFWIAEILDWAARRKHKIPSRIRTLLDPETHATPLIQPILGVR